MIELDETHRSFLSIFQFHEQTTLRPTGAFIGRVGVGTPHWPSIPGAIGTDLDIGRKKFVVGHPQLDARIGSCGDKYIDGSRIGPSCGLSSSTPGGFVTHRAPRTTQVL